MSWLEKEFLCSDISSLFASFVNTIRTEAPSFNDDMNKHILFTEFGVVLLMTSENFIGLSQILVLFQVSF